jgi:heme-degrading monooxygenase HmoA
MSAYELAQLNIGIIRGAMDTPVMAEFAANLARINALADGSPGFVWRLQTETGDATAIRPFDNPNMLLNMSVWRDLESLRQYVYSSAHTEIMRRRREWFERISEAYLVLWWLPRGHRPTVAEAIARLTALRERGPHREAFSFREHYPPPDAAGSERPGVLGDECPAL